MKTIHTLLASFIFLITVSAEEETPIKVACVGDNYVFRSVGNGSVIGSDAEAYPAQLQKLLGNGYEVRDFSLKESTALQGGKPSYSKSKEYKAAQEWLPNIVILNLGAADAKQENGSWESASMFKSQYMRLAKSFSKLKSRPQVYLCTVSAGFKGSLSRREWVNKRQLIPLIKEISAKTKFPIIDLYTLLSDNANPTPDELTKTVQSNGIAVAKRVHARISNTWNLPKDKSKVHVFLTMGQSNMAGYGAIHPQDREPVMNIVYLPNIYSGKLNWQAASHPINNKLSSHRFGLQLPFAKEYLKNHPGVTVALIPCAWGGAGIDLLKKGSDIYQDAMVKADFAKQHGVIKGILWHQGESDTVNEENSNAYAAKLQQLVKDLRQDLAAPKLPFIAGNLAEFYGTWGAHKEPKRVARINKVRDTLRNLPNDVPHTAFVESKGLQSIDHKMVHFDRQSFITFGKRYFEAYKNLTQSNK